MICEILHYDAVDPQRGRDLVRLLRYLYKPKASASRRESANRLLGPPLMFGIVQLIQPFGDTADDAADGLALQMERMGRLRCGGDGLPWQWFVHLVASFTKDDSQRLHQMPTLTEVARGSLGAAAVAVTREALLRLGIGSDRPHVLVVHGDTRHLHVHVVALLPDPTGASPAWVTGSRRLVGEVVAAVRSIYGLAQPRACDSEV